MLNIILEILSILGILLLCLLGAAVLLILLVLFFPISYKLSGKKNSEEMTVSARASWLFGLLRVRFDHPEPGRILVKILPFTVFDSGREANTGKKKTSGGKAKKSAEKPQEQKQATDAGQNPAADTGQETTADAEHGPETDACQVPTADADQVQEKVQEPEQENVSKTSEDPQTGADDDPSILKKFKKIKYTICSIYDKIKNIWENISYYLELLQEKETKRLFSHVIFRLGKILKNIRPRRIRGQILFGTGSPDTTGYAYGVYGMLSPFLGNKLLVTPDFTGAVLEGDIYISGHITIFTILWNGLRVLLDKNLRRFIRKMKAGRTK